MTYFFYMVRCADNSLYSGITTDLERRINEHNGLGGASKRTSRSQAIDKGAKYTKVRRPVALVYSEEFENRSDASKREYAVKQLTKIDKEELILSAK